MAKRVNGSFAAALERQDAAKRVRPAASASVQNPTIEVREQEYDFWLVQRLSPSRRAAAWFGDKFDLEYMGSAEFEFGAPHKSLRRMHERGDFRIIEVHLSRKGNTRPVFCVAPGPDEEAANKIAAFIGWAASDRLQAKESTCFGELFDEDFRLIEREYIHTVAWWSLDDDLLWTLDRMVAEQLLYGLEHPAIT